MDKTEMLRIAADLSAIVDRITACCEEDSEDSPDDESPEKDKPMMLGAMLKSMMDKKK